MRGNALLVAAATLLIVGSSLSMLISVPTGTAGYTARAPIVINGDGEFTLANGVTGGTGIEPDPYIIEGYDIDAGDGIGIQISYTNAHFVIRSCYIHSGSTGIYLSRVSNASVVSCDAEDNEDSISLIYSHNTSVVDNTVSAMNWGISIVYSTDCLVRWNNVTTLDEGASIVVGASDSVVIDENNITGDASHGILASMSTNCTISGNLVDGGGCLLDESIGCHLWDNTFVLSGVSLTGSAVEHSDSHEIPENNTANDLRILYLAALSGGSYDVSVAGQVIIAGCSDIKVTNGDVFGIEFAGEPGWYTAGIECIFSDNVTISNSTVGDCANAVGIASSTEINVTGCYLTNDWNGVYVENSEHVEVNACTITWSDQDRGIGVDFYQSNYTCVSDCQIREAGWAGVAISNSHDVSVLSTTVTNATQSSIYAGGYILLPYNLTFRGCTLVGARLDGFELRTVTGVTIENCTISDAERGIESYGATDMTISNNTIVRNSWVGVMLNPATLCLIARNSISGNYVGIDADYDSQDVVIVENIIAANNVGISSAALGMTTYHNDIYLNNWDVESLRAGSSWDDGYPSGGNYWDDYSGGDLFSGPGQDVPGADGIGDTPYAFPSYYGDTDGYPLMDPLHGPRNNPPVALFTVEPDIGNISTEFVLNASSSYDAEDPSSELEVRWDIGHDGTWDIGWSKEKTAKWHFATPGDNLVLLQVSDTRMFLNDSASVVHVSDVAPVASFIIIPAVGNASTSFVFDAYGSSDLENGSGALEVRWDWDNDGTWDTAWSTSKTATHLFTADGTHTVALQVRDSAGLTGNTTRQVVVESVPPTADAGPDQSVDVGALVTVDGSGSTDNVGIVNYTWSCEVGGEAKKAYGVSSTWSFTEAGAYEITLTVKDAAGSTDTDTVIITVKAKGTGGTTFSDYWWIAAIAAIVFAVAAILYLMGRKKKGSPEVSSFQP